MTNAFEIRKKLLNVAQKTGRSSQEILQYYAMERFLFRLSQSDYKKHFILKGGLLLHARELTNFRATQDIDLLGMTHNTPDHIAAICTQLCVFNFDDGIQFDPKTVATSVIKPTTDYQGVQVKFKGTIDRSKVHMHIDVGFADAVYPKPISFIFPTILPLPAPNLLGYTYESVIAEKVDAMIQLGQINSRMKDFYDVWFLANHVSFELNELAEALRATFERRKTALPKEPLLFQKEFITSTLKHEQWSNFCRLNGLNTGLEFAEITLKLGIFLKPIFDAVLLKKFIFLKWMPEQWAWEPLIQRRNFP